MGARCLCSFDVQKACPGFAGESIFVLWVAASALAPVPSPPGAHPAWQMQPGCRVNYIPLSQAVGPDSASH